MKLAVFKTVGNTLAFGLRHFPAFYLLGVVAGLPHFMYDFLPYPEWQTRIAADGAAAMIFCFAMAVMALALKRDQRSATWSVVPCIGDILGRLPTLLCVSTISAAAIVGFSALSHPLSAIHPHALLVGQIVYFILIAFFCMAVPSAAIEDAGVFGAFNRSVVLSAGSRLRIVLAFLLTSLPCMIASAAVMRFDADINIDHLWDIWSFLVLPVFNVFLFALPAVIHRSLAEAAKDDSFVETVAVFD